MKNVDLELIIAFANGSLDKETEKEVREKIDNNPDWFIEYMEVKQAMTEMGPLSAAEAPSVDEVNEEKPKESKSGSFGWLFSPGFTTGGSSTGTLSLSGQAIIAISLAVIGVGYIISISTGLALDAISTARSFDGEFTKITVEEDYIEIENNGPNIVNISITIPEIYSMDSFPLDNFDNITYINNSGYFERLESERFTMIFFSVINNYYNQDSDSSSDLRVLIFDEFDKVSQDELIER